jgi:hypothetical protein
MTGLAFLCVGLVAQYSVTVSLGGVSIQQSINRTGDHANAYQVTIPKAWSVSAWVKTSASVAAGNLTGGHGQTTGTYDVYWTGGARYGVSVTVTTNALALTGGTGTDYPATADTTVVVCKQLTIATAIDGDAVSIMAISLDYVDPVATSIGRIDMLDSGAASIEAVALTANQPIVYDITGGASNIFTGNVITSSKASHNNPTYDATLKLVSLEDSTA